MSHDYTSAELIEVAPDDLEVIMGTKPKGCVFYTDGGVRNIRFKASAGFGMHIYFFNEDTPKGIGSFPITKPTKLGYLEKNNYQKEDLVNVTHYLNINSYAGGVTSPVAEMIGVIQAFRIFMKNKFYEFTDRLVIRTDSELTVKGINEYMPVWKKNQWRKADGNIVKNITYWKLLDTLHSELNAVGVTVDIGHVYGHSNNYGNSIADQQATMGLLRGEGTRCKLRTRETFTTDKMELSPLMLDNKLLYYQGMSPTTPEGKFYYLAYTNQHPQDEVCDLGRNLIDSSIGVIMLDKPDVTLDAILSSCKELEEAGNYFPMVVDVNLATKFKRFTELTEGNICYAVKKKTRKDQRIESTDEKVILTVLDPPRNALSTKVTIDALYNIYAEYMGGDEKYSMVDITEDLYDTETNGKGVVSHKFKIVSEPAVMVELPANVDGVDKTLPVNLTLGLDLPRRRVLSSLKTNNPNVKIITWNESPRITHFAAIVTIDGGVSIWCAEHTGYFLHGGTFK